MTACGAIGAVSNLKVENRRLPLTDPNGLVIGAGEQRWWNSQAARLGRLQVDRHGVAVIGVERLDDDRKAHPLAERRVIRRRDEVPQVENLRGVMRTGVIHLVDGKALRRSFVVLVADGADALARSPVPGEAEELLVVRGERVGCDRAEALAHPVEVLTRGLEPVPYSPWLTAVAEAHAVDMARGDGRVIADALEPERVPDRVAERLGEDLRFIYHTHPGGTPYASRADLDALALGATFGSPQRTSQLVLPSGETVLYGGNWSREGIFMPLSSLFSR